MKRYVVVHYDEIGLKGSNRAAFEKLLMRNIEMKLKDFINSCRRESGQIVIEIKGDADIEKARDALSRVPGIAYFSFARKVKLELDAIKEDVIRFLEDKDFSTFRIDAKRHIKDFRYTSMELNCRLGDAVVERFRKKAKMKGADICVKVEISKTCGYISSENIPGVGGLPTDRRLKVVSLLSGGYDSPVAAYMMMRRGCEVILVHFNNQNQMSCSVKDKIVQLAEQLSKYQIKTKLYIVPFEAIQKEIVMKVRSETRMLIYRKFMMKIASAVAEKEGARFLVVGDSLSQVASQTLENLEATYSGCDKQILSPLIGMHKKEIIAITREIGTYDISTLPYGDCCSYFLPRHPELRADAKLLEETLSGFDADSLVKDAVRKAGIREW